MAVADLGEVPVCPCPLPLILGKKRRKITKVGKSGRANKTKPLASCSQLRAEAKSVIWSEKTWADNLLCMLEETFFKNGEN